MHKAENTSNASGLGLDDAGEKLLAKAYEVTKNGRSGAYRVDVFGDDGEIIDVFSGLSWTIGGPVIETGEE
jgi:hypothetical protein